MVTITHAGFHLNRLMLTLILASGPAWRTTENAGPDRVKLCRYQFDRLP